MLTKKTKIICTIGPSSEDINTLKTLSENGMNVARINFSHGSYEEHQKKIDNINALKKKGYNISLLGDTKGPEIRVGELENGSADIKTNDIVRISMKPLVGNKEMFSVSYPKLFNDLDVGKIIRIDDGKLSLQVKEKDNKKKELVMIALNDHVLLPRKSVGVPFTELNMDYISKQDKNDLLFACKNSFDYLACSFTRTADDIISIRKILDKNNGEKIQIIAKIENQQGFDNIDSILDVADGIMVARGDLGVEVNIEDVPVMQKALIKKTRSKGKIVIIATQMLESMQYSLMPTRAEVSDVANSIYEGVDAIMLSGETASGKYPLESCLMESKIAMSVEKVLNYHKFAERSFQATSRDHNDSIAFSVANTAILSKAKLIVCFSKTGNTAKRISFYRPACPILSISDDIKVKDYLGLYYGVNGMYIKSYKTTLDSYEALALEKAKEFDIKPGENIILTGGDGIGNTNLMKIITVK